ncbi:MAG: hypothetical protein IKP61_08455 [Spirochaetales bacterium]|nr:hypothetical protein [Spirochaetales bacterium]
MNDKNITKTMIVNMLESLKASLNHILETIDPEKGPTLQCKNYRGKTHLYLLDITGKEIYLGQTKQEEIRKHAQKRYTREVCRAAKKEVAQIDRCLKALDSKNGISDINGVYGNLPDALKPYVVPLSLSDDDYAARWQESNLVVKRKRIHPEDDYHRFKTLRGDYVGSKSEAIIADRLFSNAIPYHYEAAFIPEAEPDRSRPVFDAFGRLVGFEAPGFDPFGRDTLHPDFYALNKRTRKAYFWEHLGRLDNSGYCTENLNRLVRMIDAGFTIGEEILITHEDARNPLKLESIDELIAKYLK